MDTRDTTTKATADCISDCIRGLTDVLEATGPGAVAQPPDEPSAQVTDLDAYRDSVTPSPEVAAAMELSSELDKAWFEANPGRSHRVRRPIPSEPVSDVGGPPLAGLALLVIVAQAAPGIRAKVSFWGFGRPCGCEECAADAWAKFAPEKVKNFVAKAAELVLKKKASSGR
jgi:hypothetical protein